MNTTDDWHHESKVVPYILLVLYLIVIYKILYVIQSYIEPFLLNPFWNMMATATLYLIMLLITNGLLYYLYTRKPAWAMKYKINTMEWPWEKDPEAWKKLLRKSIKLYVGFAVDSKAGFWKFNQFLFVWF